MMETFDEVYADAIANDGGTYFLSRQRNRFFLGKSELRRGYYVATDDNEEIVEGEWFNARNIATFASRHIPELASDKDFYFGLWKAPSGRWYLDITQHVSEREDAEIIGKDRGQLAIWDIANSEEISLNVTV